MLYQLMCFWNSNYAESVFVIILKQEIFADICIGHILVTVFFSILFKTREQKFKAEDVILGD